MKILFTTALIEDFYEIRKKEYIDSFEISKSLIGVDNINILECFVDKQETFLNDLTENIYFSNTNIPARNKGVKEALAIKKFFEECDYNDDDIVIKQTGRYKFTSDLFFENIDKTVDANVLFGENNYCFFGVFSLKFKYFKNFINNLDFSYMENNMVCIEKLLSDYIIHENLTVKKHDKLDVLSNINNNHLVIW
jgi:hypothetical protein